MVVRIGAEGEELETVRQAIVGGGRVVLTGSHRAMDNFGFDNGHWPDYKTVLRM